MEVIITSACTKFVDDGGIDWITGAGKYDFITRIE
jgi:hypothetical protein